MTRNFHVSSHRSQPIRRINKDSGTEHCPSQEYNDSQSLELKEKINKDSGTEHCPSQEYNDSQSLKLKEKISHEKCYKKGHRG